MARTDDELEAELNDGLPNGVEATRWPAMTYEEGVDATLRWALGWTDEKPITDADG